MGAVAGNPLKTAMVYLLAFFGFFSSFLSFACVHNAGGSSSEKAIVTLIPQDLQSSSRYSVSSPNDTNQKETVPIDENMVEHAELKHNILVNPNGVNQIEGWRIVRQRGSGFYYRGKDSSHLKAGDYFGTSYGWSEKIQVIDLKKAGFSIEYMNNKKPTIYASEEFSKTYCGKDRYYLTVQLLNKKKRVLAERTTGNKKLDGPCDWTDNWVKEELSFTDYPDGVHYIAFKDAGVSSRNEPREDYYGIRMRNATLYIHSSQEFYAEKSSVIAETLQSKLSEISDSETISVSILCKEPLINEDELPAFSAGFEVNQGEISNVELASSDEGVVSDLELVSTLGEQKTIMNRAFLSHWGKIVQQKAEGYRSDVEELEEMTGLDIMGRASQIADSIGRIEINLSKNEIESLAEYSNIVQSIDVQGESGNALDSAYTAMTMNKAHQVEPDRAQQTGSGVNIYMSEAGPIGNRNPCFNPNTFYFGKWIPGHIAGVTSTGTSWEDRNTDIHATRVAQSIKVTAPHSNLYCSDEKYSLPRLRPWIYPSSSSKSYENTIHIVNYSFWNAPDEKSRDSRKWFDQDTSLERHVWNERVAAFVAAGNWCNENVGHCEVTSPGKAHNAITVGAYNDATDTMATFSRRDDPETNAIKPEIVAPGVNLRFPTAVGSSTVTSWETGIGGTSFATPLAAGMAASVASRWQWLKKQPHLIKASMLALAAKDIQTGSTNADGVGAIQWNEDGYYYYWSNYNNNFLITGGWKLIKTYNINRRNKKIRVVISWLNDINKCKSSKEKLCMDLDLKVHGPNNEYIDHDYRSSHDDNYAPNNITNNNWRMVEFTSRTTGNYKIYVWRRKNWYTRRCFIFCSRKSYSKVNLGLRVAYIDYD